MQGSNQPRTRSRLASPRPRAPSIVPPLKPMKTGEADPKERLFLEAAEKGDKATLQSCLKRENAVNVNCTDLLGRSALEIAVDNENLEIVEILLQQPTIRIGTLQLLSLVTKVPTTSWWAFFKNANNSKNKARRDDHFLCYSTLSNLCS